MTKSIARVVAAALLAWSAAGHAQIAGCDAIRAQIDAKVRASGVNDFTLSVLEADAPSSGRVVGSCELGTRKIVYERTGAPPSSAPATASKSRPGAVITECKDGWVNVGGECRPKP